METKASYMIVGGFVLALIAGLFVFAIWLANVRVASDDLATYLIYFRGSVTGLQEGGTVRYRGIPVGTVDKLRISPRSVEEVEVTVNVKADTPIRADTVASLESLGLTGIAYVQLTGGTQDSPPLAAAPGQRYPVIPSRPSNLEAVFSAAPQAIEKLGQVVDRVSQLLDERNIHDVAATLDNLKTVSDAFAARSVEIKSILDDGALAAHQLQTTLTSLQQLATKTATSEDQLTAQIGPAMEEMRKAAHSLEQFTGNLDQVVQENRRPLRDFSGQGLYALTQFLTEARAAAAAVTRLANKIEADPSHFFFSNPKEGVPAR